MLKLTYKYQREAKGVYSVYCLNTRGLHTHGKGIEGMKRMAVEASELYLDGYPLERISPLKRKPSGQTFTLDFDPVTRKCLTVVP